MKNTGRCKELLIPGATVIVQQWDKADRKTKYDLIGVYKGDRLLNIDSQAPNKVVLEWFKEKQPFGKMDLIKPECTFGKSRFDFYFETKKMRAFAEVKGVTLERDGVFLFPDAPTQRGVRHLKELQQCLKDGCRAYVIFVVQADYAEYFTPNDKTHPEFGQALRAAKAAGVHIMTLECNVTPDSLTITHEIPVHL